MPFVPTGIQIESLHGLEFQCCSRVCLVLFKLGSTSISSTPHYELRNSRSGTNFEQPALQAYIGGIGSHPYIQSPSPWKSQLDQRLRGPRPGRLRQGLLAEPLLPRQLLQGLHRCAAGRAQIQKAAAFLGWKTRVSRFHLIFLSVCVLFFVNQLLA